MEISTLTKVHLLEHLSAIYRRNCLRQSQSQSQDEYALFHQNLYNCYFENLDYLLSSEETIIFQEVYLKGNPISTLPLDLSIKERVQLQKQVGTKIFDHLYQQF